jgi:fructose-bisphosphate aldolase class II
MPLESIAKLMNQAVHGDYAVGYFESWSLESLQGVIDAAQESRSPIIIGFNGEFLSQRRGATPEDVYSYGALGAALAARASVPCGFIFNECTHDKWLEQAITAGFNLVMPAKDGGAPGEYLRRVRRLAAIAHRRGVAIEAELENSEEGGSELTDAAAAASFVETTGIDLLAVEVGNEEIKLTGRAPLDLAELEAIHKCVKIPLVLHGGTGIEDESLKAAISLGVRKVNYGTYMKQKYLAAMRESLRSEEPNPHALLGDGSSTDVVVVGRQVVRDAVLERIGLLGCCGKG